jgi:hypothetical protein
MVFPIVGGNQATGDFITNSLRFNDDDAPRLTKTFSSSGNRRTVTFSAWVKLSNLGIIRHIFSNNGADFINLESDDTLSVQLAGSAEGYLYSNRKFRDVSAWYHIVVAVDTTQGTASNRLKLYINGVQETSFSDSTNPDQNLETGFAENVQHAIGMRSANADRHFDGYLAEVNFVDGSALDPTYFGETNDNGVWIPKKPDVSSYGTNGFYMQFQQTGTGTDASGMGADTSGNTNHFAVTNLAAIDVTTDTPQNNFATWNPLDPNRDNDLSEGNTQYVSPTSAREQIRSTFGLTSGKWYWETKPTTANGGLSVGVLKENASMTLDDSLGKDAYGWSYDSDGSSRHSNSSTSSGFDTYTSNDIIGVALDLDNHEIFFYKNGTAQNSGNKAFDLDTGETYFAACGSNSNGSTETFQVNFGNAPFSISSSNSDANGHGSFEYAVPSGYFALCTKNLAEYG